MKRFFLCLLCAAVLLGGCVREQEGYVPTGGALSSDEPTAPIDTGTAELDMSLPYYPDRSLDPFSCTDHTNRMLFGLLYQGLFAVDEGYTADPILCSHYQVSRDMKTYTFYLEPATFPDGRVLTGADVVASLRRAMSGTYYQGRFRYVESVTATDDGAVRIVLTTPCEDLPVLLDVPIVPADQVGMEKPLGTGPYCYDGEGLRRRTDWWCTAVLPVTAQQIRLVEGESPSQLRDAFEFSDLSVVCADPGSEGYVEFHSDYELWDCENGIFLYLGCNMESYVLSQGQIRQSLTYAVDRDGLADAYYRGFALSATMPASPQSPHYPVALADQIRFEPERLAQAVGDVYLETNEITLLVNNDDGIRLRVARAIGETLERCGLAVTVSALPGEDYLQALEEGNFDLYLGQTRLSANMDLSAFFAPEGSLNVGSIGDTATYALCLESLANSGNYYTLHQYVLESGAIVPILFRSYAVFAQRGVFRELYPARDSVFCYSLGKDPEAVRTMAE